MRNARFMLLSFGLAVSLAACNSSKPDTHTAADYTGASAAGDPDGTMTTIVAAGYPIVTMRSSVKFPQGDTVPEVHSVLMYEHPATTPGACIFEIGYLANHASAIVKGDPVQQPCDGKQQARFRIAGVDIAFVARLEKKDYKGTPATIFEIGDHTIPSSMHVVY